MAKEQAEKRGRLVFYALRPTPDHELRKLLSCKRPLAPGDSGGVLQRRHSLPFITVAQDSWLMVREYVSGGGAGLVS